MGIWELDSDMSNGYLTRMLTATEFRARLDRLGLPRQEAADRLGLSLNGLFHQMRGDRPVSRQTELLLGHLEREQARHKRQPRSRQRPVAAALALAFLGIAATPPAVANEPLPPAPYSCRLLYDEQRKCAFGGCDARTVERLHKECLRDGGRP
jgi:hypothetical protein